MNIRISLACAMECMGTQIQPLFTLSMRSEGFDSVEQ